MYIFSLKRKYEEIKSKYDRLSKDQAKMQSELDDCRSKRIKIQADLDDCLRTKSAASFVAPTPAPVSPPSTSAGLAAGGIDYAAAFEEDNLQIVEGIGPAYEKHLKANNMNNWRDLANSNQADLRKIMDLGGSRYGLAETSTWPIQAQFAVNRDWAGLHKYQLQDGDAKIEKMAAKILGITLKKPNDLKLVEGIGPKTEELLKANGIDTWKDLSGTSVMKLKSILEGAGSRFALIRPETWPKQAQLAVDGKWKELQEYQDYLDGGVDPSAS